jgi:dTDP-D-glucose 4,6-dehydratase
LLPVPLLQNALINGLVHHFASIQYANFNYRNAGFVGRHIAEHFQDRAEARVLDNLRCGFKGNLSGLNCQLIVGSILDRDLVREAMKGVDFVFHLAAMVSVQESVEKPNECAEINAWGIAIVLEEAARGASEKADLQQFGCNLRRSRLSRDSACDRNGWT